MLETYHQFDKHKDGASSSKIPVYIELFHQATEADYLTKLEQLKTDWSAPFLEYYEQEIHSEVFAHQVTSYIRMYS